MNTVLFCYKFLETSFKEGYKGKMNFGVLKSSLNMKNSCKERWVNLFQDFLKICKKNFC